MINLFQLTMPYRCGLIINAYKGWLKPHQKVLDIGCGNGIVANSLIQKYNIKVTVCDVENHLIYNFPFVKIRGDKLPFTNSRFDIVLLNDVLHHLEKGGQVKLINEALRVGSTILIFEAKPTFYGNLADVILNKVHYGQLYTPLSFRTVSDWKELFKNLKLKCQVKELKRPFWYPFSHITFRLESNKK